MSIVSAKSLVQPFIDAGIVPKNCRRVIIDIAAHDVLRLYYEVYGDEAVVPILEKMMADKFIADLYFKGAVHGIPTAVSTGTLLTVEIEE